MPQQDFVCIHCHRLVASASQNEIWYAAGKPNCSAQCKRAEDEKLAQTANAEYEQRATITVEDLEFEQTEASA